MEEQNTIIFTQPFNDGDSEDEVNRRADGLKQVLEQFVKKGETYGYKVVPAVVAYRETEQRISTDLDNDDVLIAMTKVAQAKGWQHYRAVGSSTFNTAVEKQAQRQTQTANEQSPKNHVSADKVEKTIDSQQRAKQQALIQSINDQYRVAGKKYYFKDYAGHVNQLAFKDNGDTLSTRLNTERVTRSIVDLAQSKGWSEIKVSGHKEFKRQVWRAASQRGIKILGYTPDSNDLDTVSNTSNTIHTHTAQPKLTPKNTSASRDTTGILVAHGQAPYQNNPENGASYFVTIRYGDKERTVWGVGLPDALTESGVKIGENVNLKRTGSQSVTVKDNQGQQLTSKRNSWTIERTDKAQVITAVAHAVATKKITNKADRERIAHAVQARVNAQGDNLPQVKMYDNNATPATVVEPANPKDNTNNQVPELT